MARITSEKAVEQIGNRYDLILIASRRARELGNGYAAHIDTKDSNVVKAIREIEMGHVGRDYLHKSTEVRYRKEKTRTSIEDNFAK